MTNQDLEREIMPIMNEFKVNSLSSSQIFHSLTNSFCFDLRYL